MDLEIGRAPGYEAIPLNHDIKRAMADPEVAAFFDGLGAVVAIGSAADVGRLMDAEGANGAAAAVKASGASLEQMNLMRPCNV